MKRTAFEKDSNSSLAELFLQLRDYIKICIGNGVKEKHNENTTSFFSKEGGFCSIKVKDDFIYLNWFKGAFLEDNYGVLLGKGKVARSQKVYKFDKNTRQIIKEYIAQSLIKLIEYNELMKMRKKYDGSF